MCFAPLLLLGYLVTLQPNPAHTTNLNDTALEFQTCERGPGVDVKLTHSGVHGAHLQYGVPVVDDTITLTFTPKFGVGYLDRPVPELSTRTNFSLGAQALVGYEDARLGVEYWHQSNAGLGHQNIGLDMILVMGGLVFH